MRPGDGFRHRDHPDGPRQPLRRGNYTSSFARSAQGTLDAHSGNPRSTSGSNLTSSASQRRRSSGRHARSYGPRTAGGQGNRSQEREVYSLGLILHEILTGKRAFQASTLQELVMLRETGTITNPSTLVRDLDPLIERVVLRCRETDPDKRPASALQVAATLPGGNPLAAALAARETPSPEMVAAAGATEGMKPRLALGLLTSTIVGMIGYLFIAEAYRLSHEGVLENPPEVLASRAREIVLQLGYREKAERFRVFLRLGDGPGCHTTKRPARWNVLSPDRPSPVLFWYRQSLDKCDLQDFCPRAETKA